MVFQTTLARVAQATVIAAAAASLSLFTVPAAMAAAPMVKTQAPGYFRFMLGDFEVTALSDGTVDLPVDQLLHEPAAKTAQALTNAFLKVPLETSVNAYLVNTGSKLVLIDTGAGGLFGPTLGKLITNLKASGYEPGQIDEIYITHLHPDHVGGLVADGAVVFSNATVRFDQGEADFWLSQENLAHAPDSAKGFFQGAMASLNPYAANKNYRPFRGETELVPGVRSWSTYGHTPGHTSYVVESQGQKLVLLGDLISVVAVQLDHPGVTISFDNDAKAAAKARAKVFAQLAKEGAVVGASHIQFPGVGHLRATGKSFQWVPLNYTRAR